MDPPPGSDERAHKEKKKRHSASRKDKPRDRNEKSPERRDKHDKGKKRRQLPGVAPAAASSPFSPASKEMRFNAQITPRYMQEVPRGTTDEIRCHNPLLRDPNLLAAAERRKIVGQQQKGGAGSPITSPTKRKGGSSVPAPLPFLGSQFDLEAARMAWKQDAAGLGTRQTDEGKHIVVSGAVEDLVSFLADDQHFQNKDYLEAFVLSHPWFLPSPVFFANLVARFDANLTPRDAKPDVAQRALYMRLRIINVIKKWLELNPHNFIEDKVLGTSFEQWVERMTASGGRSQAWATHLSDLRRKQMRLLEWSSPRAGDTELRREGKPPPPLLPKSLGRKELQLLDIDALELARQITLAEYDIFRRISPTEFYRKAWEKKERSPNINALINRFNQLSYWVASEVLSVSDAKARQATIGRFLETIRHLHELGNFNGIVEISAGLNLGVVQRLKTDWRNVPPKLAAILRSMNDLMAPHNNWASYRRALVERPLPAIPFQGVYLTDMVFIEELPDTLPGGLINFEKMHLIGRLLADLITAQRTPYALELVPSIDEWLRQRTSLSDEVLTRLSKDYEPEMTEAKAPETSESSATESAQSAAERNAQDSAPALAEAAAPAQASEYSYILEFEMSELVGARAGQERP